MFCHVALGFLPRFLHVELGWLLAVISSDSALLCFLCLVSLLSLFLPGHWSMAAERLRYLIHLSFIRHSQCYNNREKQIQKNETYKPKKEMNRSKPKMKKDSNVFTSSHPCWFPPKDLESGTSKPCMSFIIQRYCYSP